MWGFFLIHAQIIHTKMIKTTKVKIGKTKYVLKDNSYRAMFLFEEISGKSMAESGSLYDTMLHIYCILKTSNENFEYEVEEFIDMLDDDGDYLLTEFAKLNINIKK